MPELDILHGFEYLTSQLIRECSKHQQEPLEARIVLYPRVFAVGTARKEYTTCTVDDSPEFDYDPALEPAPPDYTPDLHDAKKSEGTDFARYLKPLGAGELLVKARGKEIVFAAGKHAIRVHFGLEGTMAILRTEDYQKIVAHDCPGHNTDKTKAAQMRSFIVPPDLTVPGARNLSRKEQSLAIFAAVVGTYQTLIMVDHNRLLRIHVMSLSRSWTQADLTPGSQLWAKLWSANHSPDWIYEREEAQAALDHWRARMLAVCERAPSLTKGKKKASKPALEPALIDVMCNTQESFNGIGQHTAQDLCHELAIFPSIPPAVLCADNEMYSTLRDGIPTYASQFASALYRLRCLSTPNLDSPLAYNYKSDTNYLNQYLKVYCKSSVRMARDDYNKFARRGLFDSAHTIGAPYVPNEHQLIDIGYKDVPVYQYSLRSGNPIYTVIVAQQPQNWRYSEANRVVAKDARQAGFSTTIGPASFHMFKQNQHDWRAKGKPGRKAIVRTGQRGRPARATPRIGDLRQRASSGMASHASHERTASPSASLESVTEGQQHITDGEPPRKRRRTARSSGVLPTDRVTRSNAASCSTTPQPDPQPLPEPFAGLIVMDEEDPDHKFIAL